MLLEQTCRRMQDGYTALMYAALEGRADPVRLLVEAGADLNAKNNVRDVHEKVIVVHCDFVQKLQMVFCVFHMISNSNMCHFVRL